MEASPNAWCRHPLAFLVEAADDICYSIIDLEDGCSLGLISESEVHSLLGDLLTQSKSKLGTLSELSTREERVGYLRALAIGDLTQQFADLFLDHEKEMLDGKFDSALADVSASREVLKKIISV
ncbi:MAG TPA: dGTPase, partial [Chryseosolibacter sp.]|nr:dGTPase [Chryseosolibacter sp.]